jgi:dienelactone hydrolase
MAEQVGPRYEPVGWTQWPGNHDFSFQFMRTLGAAQEGASTISECFLAASRMTLGDTESWHREWMTLAEASRARADAASAAGNHQTAKVNWLRAANYFRSAEFFLRRRDPRRLATFDAIEACSHRYLAAMSPRGEVVKVPYLDGAHLDAYFIRPHLSGGKHPTVICFGGLDEYKDELLHEIPKHALPRGFAVLLVDLPGQGGTLRRQRIPARHDTEVPVGKCVDYLTSRPDVDPDRILLYGASIGGYYSSRAASFEHRLKAVVSDGGMFDQPALAAKRALDPDGLLAEHIKFITCTDTVEEAGKTLGQFKLEGVIDKIRCPYLLVFGEHDFLGIDQFENAYAYATQHDLKVTRKLFTAVETGAAHCQIDNPTIGQEYIFDWLAAQVGIDQAAEVGKAAFL